MFQRLLEQNESNLAQWQPTLSEPWSDKSHDFDLLDGIDTLCEANKIIDRQNIYHLYPSALVNSYRSYLIQVIKECAYLMEQSAIVGNADCLEVIDTAVDHTLSYAFSWRLTASAIQHIFDQGEIVDPDNCPETLWSICWQRLDRAFETGSLYNMKHYIQVMHVIYDLAFDLGWHHRYHNVMLFKKSEGLTDNPERSVAIRNVCLTIARSFYRRDYKRDSKTILQMGFPDVPEMQSQLSDKDLHLLLLDCDSRTATKILLSETFNTSTRNLQCNQLVEGALRLLRGE